MINLTSSADPAAGVLFELLGDPLFAHGLPCHTGEPDLFFAERPDDLERAKALCSDCPLRAECLSGALSRGEPWGVWGGEIFAHGEVIARKRPRGRPRKVAA